MYYLRYENISILSDSNTLRRRIRPSAVEDLLQISHDDTVLAKTVEDAAAMHKQINLEYEN